jgi:drug/metabolite transporter (DMT)-like permease
VAVPRKHLQACLWLIAGTGLWGLSFPIVKAIFLKQDQLVPNAPSAFFASLVVVARFGVGAIIVLAFCAHTLRTITRAEIREGVGLAIFGGLGILFQMDGLAHTSASTSAFLTQFYCLLIPIWAAVTQRALPTLAVIISSALVLAGAAILASFNLPEMKIGRGELETLIAAIFFAGQILWLEKPEFARNRTSHFTFVMFAGTALLAFPVALFYAPQASAIAHAYSNSSVLLMAAALVLFCTVAAYGLMNIWQRHITATEAGLIYCLEPVAASALALFLPEMLSRLAGIQYANERLTRDLLLGGGLILAANVLIQIEAARRGKLKPGAAVRDELASS